MKTLKDLLELIWGVILLVLYFLGLAIFLIIINPVAWLCIIIILILLKGV